MMNIESTITKDEVLNAQNDWKNGIIDIGKKFINNEDYESRAIKHLNDLFQELELSNREHGKLKRDLENKLASGLPMTGQ